jgi:DNA-binding transcriptional ArsR family regulator
LGYESPMASADLLLHPIRLRIIKAFLGDRTLTTAELSAELDDVPEGSLYRHMARLAKAGVLQIAAERKVRGTTERTYRLRPQAASLGRDEAAAMTRDDRARAFMAFVAGMLSDYDQYLASGGPDPKGGGADYRMGAVWLSDAELIDFMREVGDVVQKRVANAPRKGRRRRMLYGVFLPGS